MRCDGAHMQPAERDAMRTRPHGGRAVAMPRRCVVQRSFSRQYFIKTYALLLTRRALPQEK